MSESLRRELSDLRNRDMAATQVRVAPLLRRSTLGRGDAAVARAAESASRVYCGAKHTPSHSFIHKCNSHCATRGGPARRRPARDCPPWMARRGPPSEARVGEGVSKAHRSHLLLPSCIHAPAPYK